MLDQRLLFLSCHKHRFVKKIPVILVEDNALTLEMLANDIFKYHKEIKVIGTATSVVQAAKLLSKKKSDILFLNIMLGAGTGF
jgi:two-component system LytT family response regulator